MKDKEWLKEKVQTMIEKEYRCYDPLIQQWKHTCRVIMDLIEQLEEPETTEKKAWELVSGEKSLGAKYHEQLYKTVINLWHEDKEEYTLFEFNKEVIERFNKSKKTVIPRYVADYIKDCEEQAIHWFEAMDGIASDYYADKEDERTKKVYEWVVRNPDKFVDAFRNGYEVEKEKLYYVLDNKKRTLLWKYPVQVKNSGGYELETIKRKEAYTLTEKEIKDYDERFWQFAVPIEEEAE